MSSEAEKRQRLRERRAAKIRDGASRLGKITGDYSEAKKDAETIRSNPLDTPETPISQLNNETTKVNNINASQARTTGVNPAASKRISQTFEHDDPEIEDISNFEQKQTSQPRENNDEAQQFEQMLQQMLGSVKHQHGSNGLGANGSDPNDGAQFDIFSKLLNGAGGQGGDPFASLNALQSNKAQGYDPLNPDVNLEQIEYQKQLSEYNKFENDKFKAKFMLIKFVISLILALYFYGYQGFYSSSTEIFRAHKLDSGFTKIWLTLEILFTSYYALHLNKIEDSHYNYNSKILKVLGYIPDIFLPSYYKNKIRWFVKYQELIHLIIFDLSIIIFVFGILSFWHGDSVIV